MTLFVFGLATPVSAGAASRAYAATRTSGDTVIEMRAGETREIVLKYKNAGASAWKNSGRGFLSLYATRPYKRKSAFWRSDWYSRLQPARLQEKSVAPGKTGTFTFTLHAPFDPGAYVEQFQLAAENVDWVWGSAVRVTIKVLPELVTADTPVNAKAWFVMDAETGEPLLEQNADDVRSIASITKLMTVMVAREQGANEDAVVALQRSDEVGGGRLRVPVGTKLTVRNLAASAVVGSANNAANALARSTGLPKDAFVEKMNGKAAALGLASTSFADPTGIKVENRSTAREVARMARTAFADPWIAEFAARPEYEVATARGPRSIKNTNKLVGDEAIEVVAGKTGFIYEAGYTLVTRLKKEGRPELIIVVLGSDSQRLTFRDTKALAERAWAENSSQPL